MSAFIVACVLMASQSHYGANEHWADRQRPIEACHGIEENSELYGFDKWTVAALAYHESRYIPDVVSGDRKDYGFIQVRHWTTKLFLPVCLDKSYLLSVDGGIVCAFAAISYARNVAHSHGLPGTDWIKCFATGTMCKGGRWLRDIHDMRDALVMRALDWESMVTTSRSSILPEELR